MAAISDREATPITLDRPTAAIDAADRRGRIPETAHACLIVIQGRALGRTHTLDDRPVVLGRGAEAGLVFDDAGVSRIHARIEPTAAGHLVRDLDSTNGLFVNGEKVAARLLADGDRIQLGSGTILKFRFQDPLEEEAQRRLYESATRDPLTGVYNRRYLMETLEAEYAHCVRHGVPLSALILDLDHFKSINDRHGHPAGDQVLRAVAQAAQTELRAEDVFARYGGEEFAAALRHMTAAEALAGAERIRARVAGLGFEFGGAALRVTVSVGVSTFSPSGPADVPALLAAADAALYWAKRNGRDRVAAAPAPASVLPVPDE